MLDEKQYPITTGQAVLFYADTFNFIRSWINVAAVVDFQHDIDEKKMLQAISISLMRIPSASLRLRKNKDKTVTQYFSHELPTGVEYVDLSSLTEEAYEAQLEKWAKTPFPNRCMDTQLEVFKLVRRPGGFCSMFLCVCHYAFDAYAIMTAVKYIMNTYLALKNGTEIPKELHSPIPLLEAEEAYFKSSHYQRDLDYWRSTMDPNDEPYFCSLAGKNDKHRQKNARTGNLFVLFQNKAAHENLRIPAEIVNGVLEKAAQWKVSPQTIYHLAYNTYLSIINEVEDVTINSAVARRATLMQKRSGGTMVNSVGIRTKLSLKNTTVLEGCTSIYRRLTESFRHANLPFREIGNMENEIYHNRAGIGYLGFSMCYQPYFTLENNELSVTFRRLNNGGASQPCYLTIMPRDASGDLWANYEYITPYYKKEHMTAAHDFAMKFIAAALEAPESTLDEISKKCI